MKYGDLDTEKGPPIVIWMDSQDFGQVELGKIL